MAPLLETHEAQTRFIDAGGRRFEVHTAGDDSSKRLALLLHGFPEHAISWRHQLPMLASLGYRVWAPNQRGYGQSHRPPEIADYSLAHLVDDVGVLIDASGAEHVTLFGHDWGGAVAWAAALTHARPQIERLVVMNLPHPQKFAENLRGNWRQRIRSLYILFFQIPGLPERLLTRNNAQFVANVFAQGSGRPDLFPQEVLEVYRENALQPGAATAMLNWYRAAVRGREDLGDRFLGEGKLYIPTLMVWGENDKALGKELTYGTEELVEDFTLRYLPTSHWVNQEAPEEVNRIVEAWLTGQPVPNFETNRSSGEEAT